MLCEVGRKVFFLLVWSKEHFSDLLLLQKVIELEHNRLLKELKVYRNMESKILGTRKASQSPQNTLQQPVILTEEL